MVKCPFALDLFEHIIFVMKANSNVWALELFSFSLMNEKLLLKLVVHHNSQHNLTQKKAEIHRKERPV